MIRIIPTDSHASMLAFMLLASDDNRWHTFKFPSNGWMLDEFFVIPESLSLVHSCISDYSPNDQSGKVTIYVARTTASQKAST